MSHRNVSGDGAATASDQAPRIVPRHKVLANQVAGKPQKPVTASSRKPEPVKAEPVTVHDTARSFSESSRGEINTMFEGFVSLKTWGLWLIGLISVGFGLQITLTTRVVENDLVNFILGAGTVASMCYGLFFANKLFKGLRAGAFIGFSKFLAIAMLLLITWEEVTAMPAKFDTDLAIFYIKFIGPICLGVYFLATMILVLMKPDEMRSRKLNALNTRTEHNKALREVRLPERKAKAEARAEKMGAFAAWAARTKLSVLTAIFSVVRGWSITLQQAWALAGDKHEELGTHIQSYESGGKKKRSKSTARKAEPVKKAQRRRFRLW